MSDIVLKMAKFACVNLFFDQIYHITPDIIGRELKKFFPGSFCGDAIIKRLKSENFVKETEWGSLGISHYEILTATACQYMFDSNTPATYLGPGGCATIGESISITIGTKKYSGCLLDIHKKCNHVFSIYVDGMWSILPLNMVLERFPFENWKNGWTYSITAKIRNRKSTLITFSKEN